MPAYKEKNSPRWYVSTKYTDWQGVHKRKLKRGFATKREALEWERRFQLQSTSNMDMTFEAFVELYYRDIRPRLKENTFLTKANIINGKIVPYFAQRKVSEITAKDVRDWQNMMLAHRDEKGKPYSPGYLREIHHNLTAIFNHAVKFYDLPSNPAAKAGSMGADERAEMLFWTKEEYLKFADAMMDKPHEQVYDSRPPLIDGLLCSGTYLFVGAPKLGKSFLMAQLAYQVSLGRPLWGYNVRQGTVLYLALEDEYRRLQERLFRMFGVEGTDELYFATSVRQLGGGLQAQLDRFVRDHPNTKLIIIDTLQKVRENGGDRYSYASDYDIVSQLKSFADQRGICLLLVHHTRKQQADDKFDMISGTNGLLGAADGAFMLQKEKRTGNAATLEVSGRDQQDQKLHLVRNLESLIWELESVETELWKEPPDPILEAVARMMTDQSWTGTPSQLVEEPFCLIALQREKPELRQRRLPP